ncbi:CCL4 protein, partial [Nothocercus nigrocapillus]|nr:CCL4 protein [Nothocercus nigrocapillus]
FLSFASAALYTPTECCIRHAQRRVRLINLRSFYETPRDCSLPAIVFVTLGGDKVCADPERPWVKKAKNVLSRKK